MAAPIKLTKLLLAGTWQHIIYEPACADALQELGVRVIPFKWAGYFRRLAGKIELKYVIPGPATLALNRDLIRCVRDERPDIVFVWRGTHVLPQTLRAIRQHTDALLVSYNNDDPFSPQYREAAPLHQRRLWRYFCAAIPEYDIHFVYRQHNIDEFYQAGAKNVHLSRSYYIPTLHRPMTLTLAERERYGCDVVLMGHYDPPRLKYLQALVSADVAVRSFGPAKSWTAKRLGPLSEYFGRVHAVVGDEYAKALCGAKMCLCSFSRLNRDTYTRRVFEIPACGRLLLSERTMEMQSLYTEGTEAVYFSTSDELVMRVKALLRQPERIEEMAQAGRARCLADRHDVVSRMKEFVRIVEDL